MKNLFRKLFCRPMSRTAAIIIFLFISIFLELALFNFDFFASLGNTPFSPAYEASDSSIEITDLDCNVKYIYLDLHCNTLYGETIPIKVNIYGTDEGNAISYKFAEVTVQSTVEGTKYYRLHSYGKLKSLKIDYSQSSQHYVKADNITLNANVPFSFNIVRVLAIFLILIVLYAFRPSSSIYRQKLNGQLKQTRLIFTIVTFNILIYTLLIQMNATYISAPWSWHRQYAQLAQAFTEGRVDLELPKCPELEAMENPYDTTLRSYEAPSAPWDISYYNNKYYVYFGAVPVLIFYLPYYLLTGEAFPTHLGIYICAVLTLILSFVLIKKIIQRWFPKTTLGVYLLISLILGNGLGNIPFLMTPSFYALPFIMSQAFILAGLSLWINAADFIDKSAMPADKYTNQLDIYTSSAYTSRSKKRGNSSINRSIIINLLAGSLCMAIVAGCRPTFLIASFFVFLILGTALLNVAAHNKCDRSSPRTTPKSLFTKQNVCRFIAFAVPYVIVAAAVMYYNYIRFGSVFDFGAGYQLTTNDVTKRGYNLGRLSDGIFMYLFQFPNISPKFPYIMPVPFNSDYVGKTIWEVMYGGTLFTHCFALINVFAIKVKEQLKNKKLFSFVIFGIIASVFMVIFVTEAGGILSRYESDYSWLLLLSAVIIFLQLYEAYKDRNIVRYLILFAVIAAFSQFVISLFIGLDLSNIKSTDTQLYYNIKSWLP